LFDVNMKKVWTIRLAALLVLAGALDLWSTDLRYESNPVLLVFGKSWGRLLLLKGVVSILLIVAFYCGLTILERRRPQVVAATGPISFLGWLFFKEKTSLFRLFVWGWPRDWGAVASVALLGAGVCGIGVGFSAAAMNSLEAIRSPIHLVGFHAANVLFSGAIGLYLAYVFLRPRSFVGQGAAPNGGPAGSVDNPGAPGGPPSVS
jgi:hypothetical protein